MRITSTDLYKTLPDIILEVPYTDGLNINRNGDIKGVKKFKKDGTWRVNLPIIHDGQEIILANLDLGVLTSIVFKGYQLPWQWWGDIKLFYKDGDSYNISPDNIAHQMYPDHFVYEYEGECYKVIPNFTRYGISKEGVIYYPSSQRACKLIQCTTVKGGYFRSALYPDYHDKASGQVTVYRHRLLALCYPVGKDLDIKYSKDHDTLHVNHINHTPGDDWLDNLEWLTRSENALHSVNKGGKWSKHLEKIIVYDLVTAEYTLLHSYKQVGKFTNSDHTAVSRYLKNGDSEAFKGRYRMEVYKSDIVYDEHYHMATREPHKRDYIKSGNIRVTTNNEDKMFDNYQEMERYLGITKERRIKLVAYILAGRALPKASGIDITFHLPNFKPYPSK